MINILPIRQLNSLGKLTLVLAAFWIGSCSVNSKLNKKQNVTITAMDLNTANGIWKFANNVSGATDLFLLEDSLITVRLTFISLNPNASPDGYYKLKAKWEGNTLNYLPPAADWVALAVFQDGRFVSVLENQPYTKCTINELNEYQKAILNQRIAWKYTE